MGSWYWIGVVAGLGVAIGCLAAGLISLRVVTPLLAAAAGAVIGVFVFHWYDGIAGAVGGIAGAFGTAPIVAGALRRGGTRGGLAVLIAVGAIVTAALAFVPVVGYLETVALPALAIRLRGRTPERHAGLRTLARD
jgi:hypothetical protein